MGLQSSENSEVKDYSKIIESSKLENAKLQNSNKQQTQFILNLEAKIKDLQIAHNDVEIQAQISKKKIDEKKEAILR